MAAGTIEERVAALERLVAELTGRPTAGGWLTTAELAGRVRPARGDRWWQRACQLGLVAGAKRHPESKRWLVPAETADLYNRTGVIPVVGRSAATSQPAEGSGPPSGPPPGPP